MVNVIIYSSTMDPMGYDFSGVEDQLPVEGLMSKLQPLQLLQRLVPGLLESATYGGYWDRNGRFKANS